MTDEVEPFDARPLSTKEFDAASEAILDAYPQTDDIRIRIRRKWGLNVREWVFWDRSHRDQVHGLLEWTEGTGHSRELIGLLWSERPHSALDGIARTVLSDLEAVQGRYADRDPQPATVATTKDVLEAQVTSRSFLLSVGNFDTRFERARRAVCRVEAGGLTGTGFLIGRRTVLTNYHVVERAIGEEADGADVVCRFDYLKDGDEGRPISGRAGRTWLGPHRPYSPSDLSGMGEPGPDELDFAVIHLAEPLEDDRAPLILSGLRPVVVAEDVALILQHPEGDPMRVALGSVVDFPGGGLRYRYNVTTREGSSGAPVFSAALDLIALHHAADPDRKPAYNQAVPIWRVAEAVRAEGLDLKAL